MPKFVVDIGPGAKEVRTEGVGFAGTDCKAKGAFIERLTKGEIVSQEMKPDAEVQNIGMARGG